MYLIFVFSQRTPLEQQHASSPAVRDRQIVQPSVARVERESPEPGHTELVQVGYPEITELPIG